MIVPPTATMSASISVSALPNAAALTSSRRPQGDQHHARVARLDHHQPLATAEGDTADADSTGFGHAAPITQKVSSAIGPSG